MTTNDKFEALKMKLKTATKLKLARERDLSQIRDRERTLNEKLAASKAENELLEEQLENFKIQIAQAQHQISLIKICSASEESKIDAHMAILKHYYKGFQGLFDKERDVFDLRMKAIKEKASEEEEQQRQNEIEIAKTNEQKTREIAAVEKECDALERECGILKKRNNAIMLKLRRKLMETENARRELLK